MRSVGTYILITLLAVLAALAAIQPGFAPALPSVRQANACCAEARTRVAPASAEETFAVQFDPSRSVIAFTLRSFLHTVHGQFRLNPSVIEVENGNGSASGSLVVNAARGATTNATINRRMMGILKAERYPVISFSPLHFSGRLGTMGGVSQVELTGILRLDGTPHLIRVPVEVRMTPQALSASGRLVVPYVTWGITDPSTFIFRVSKEVDIDFHVIGKVRAITESDFRASVTGQR